ncbi:MAG: 4'-phosphopantetheinyl transferase superfamily protein [Synechococcaceae cyanobacterium SM1_2_3]|nr:4'-phosphopantetheinyl transferase superfamily protein [Synechococcaceae cyanobacterium SM1_2_3]
MAFSFFTCWTRKEAIAKALGGGLSSGLRTLEVCFPADELAESRVNLRDKQGRQWNVLNLPLEPGWSGALAAAGMDWHWQGRRWA